MINISLFTSRNLCCSKNWIIKMNTKVTRLIQILVKDLQNIGRAGNLNKPYKIDNAVLAEVVRKLNTEYIQKDTIAVYNGPHCSLMKLQACLYKNSL